MRPDGFVLAGGRSSRMGSDKARAPLAVGDGWVPLAVATLQSLEPVCDRRVLVRRGPADGLPWSWPSGEPIDVLREPICGEPHPLWGVAAALRAARTAVALILPCDVPGVRPETLATLVDRAPAVARDPSGRHPLVAALPAAWADRAAEAAGSGGRVMDFVASAVAVDADPIELRNLNGPDALGPGPVADLFASLAFLPRADRLRAAAGERVRLSARGMVDPGRSDAVPSRGAEEA